jgi:ribosomal protein L37AE/L43A
MHFQEKRREYNRLYRQNNCEKLREYGKEYNRINSDKRRQYYIDNADRLNGYLADKITCQFCGSVIARGGYARHTRTNKHMKNMEKN